MSYIVREPIHLSPLGFGCAPLMGKISKSQALKAMNLAFDLGVTHFDVARSYGFGRAERVVGEFLKGRRDQITVTSKFGVVPPTMSWSTRKLIPLARTAANFFPGLKQRLKKKSGQLLAERRFDVDFARQCLDQSLSELATDYIDIYLIHEPNVSLLTNPDQIAEFLEDSVIAGKIRRWGFAYGSVDDYHWASTLGGDVLQFEGNIATLPSCGPLLTDARQHIVTRPFMGRIDGKPTWGSHNQDLEIDQILKEFEISLTEFSLCLAHRIAGQFGSVVCSMFSSEHIRNNIRTINELSEEKILIEVTDKLIQSRTSMSHGFSKNC